MGIRNREFKCETEKGYVFLSNKMDLECMAIEYRKGESENLKPESMCRKSLEGSEDN